MRKTRQRATTTPSRGRLFGGCLLLLVACGGKTAGDGGSAPSPSATPTAAPTSLPPRPPQPEPGQVPITQASGGFSCGPKVCNAPAEDCCYTDALATACVPHGTCKTADVTSCDSGSCTNGGRCCISVPGPASSGTSSRCAVACDPPEEVACRGYDDRCEVGVCDNQSLAIFSCHVR